jgi:hypothetical protein
MSGSGMMKPSPIPADVLPGKRHRKHSFRSSSPAAGARIAYRGGCRKPKKDLKAAKNRLIVAIVKYLEDCDVIKKGEVHETGDIIKLFYTQATNLQISSGERFVDYLSRFWDWNGARASAFQLTRGKRTPGIKRLKGMPA